MTGLEAPALAPVFPPLLTGEAVEGPTDPFDKARVRAAMGCDAGLVVHNVQADRLRAAMVFAPEVALEAAMAALPLCGVGFQNALGALGPPELAVHLDWAGGLRVNGARCGCLRAAAATREPEAVPGWLVVGLELPLIAAGAEGGETPDQTALYAEGCAEVAAVTLLEAWARHTLVWMNRWDAGELRALHNEWHGLAHGIGEEITVQGRRGTWVGVDDRFGMLLRDAAGTHLIPLSTVLEEAP